MAMSGTIKNNFRTGYGIELDWRVLGQDAERLKSTMEFKLYWVSYGSNYRVNSTAPKTGAISATTYAGSGGTKTFDEPNAGLNGNQRKLLETYTKEISHFEDGGLRVDMVGRFDCKVTLSGKYISSTSVSGVAIVDPIELGNISIKKDGWKDGQVYVKAGGWHQAKEVWVKKEGTWKRGGI